MQINFVQKYYSEVDKIIQRQIKRNKTEHFSDFCVE